MSDLETVQDFITAGLVIIIISIILTLAWWSTYVRQNQFIAATIVVLQQESPSHTMRPTTLSSEQNSEVPIESNEGSGGEISNILEATRPNLSQESNSAENPNNEIMPEVDAIVKTEESITEYDAENMECAASLPAEPKVVLEKIENIPSVKKHFTSLSQVDDDTIHSEEKKEERAVIPDDDIVAKGFIRIKLKFLDDSQRLVKGQLTQLVGNFKRANFQIELSTNCAVKLIFNGQLLNRDQSTLGQYGLFDNCVVHCYVGQPQSEPANETGSNSNIHEMDDLDLSEILSPLLLIVMAFLWYLRYEYPNIFNLPATFILVCLTALLLVSHYALSITFNISLGFNNPGDGGSQQHSPGEPRRTSLEHLDVEVEETSRSMSSSRRSPVAQDSTHEPNSPQFDNASSSDKSNSRNISELKVSRCLPQNGCARNTSSPHGLSFIQVT